MTDPNHRDSGLPSSPLPRIAVVGAGLSGLICARTLHNRGLEVAVFDKGREVGGRMSTRLTRDGQSFDHGAQYFTARDPRFQSCVRTWLELGLVARWDAKIVNLGSSRLGDPPRDDRFVGVPGMNAVCKHLAKDLCVTRATHISGIKQDAGGNWVLYTNHGPVPARFDCVVLAMPPSQAAELLPPGSHLRAQATEVEMKPCWAVMLILTQPSGLAYDAAFVDSDTLSWIAKNSAKPGRPPSPESWVLHASPEWSARHLEDDKNWVEAELVSRFVAAVDLSLQPESATAHRWRFAKPAQPLRHECLFDRALRLGVCGDWCAGPRVEGAFLSGADLAARILGQLDSQTGSRPFPE